MNVYIIDDEQGNRDILEIMVGKYFPEFSIIGSTESVDDAIHDEKLKEAHLLFLDVMMPNKTGFDLLHELQEYPFEVIFVSGYDEFAIKAFSFSAIDYILKPIDKDQMIAAVLRAVKRVEEKNKLRELDRNPNKSEPVVRIEVSKNDKVHLIDLQDVAYFIGSSGGYTEIFAKNGENYLLSSSLKQLEPTLESSHQFVRVNKSLIINIADIQTIDKGQNGYIALKTNNYDFFVSRRRKREVLQLVDVWNSKSM